LIGNTDDLERIGQISLGYTQTNGSPALRHLISGMYARTTEQYVQVTKGGSEANLLALWSLTEPGDEILLMLPNYMQIWGLAHAFGGIVKPFYLREEDGWAPDLSELKKLLSLRTRIIAVCHPNNPTGSILSEGEIRTICEMAASVGAWVLADEIYRGAERSGVESPSFWGCYERVIITGGLSKAYGLPGLRIGWLAVRDKKLRQKMAAFHDYTTICSSAPSEILSIMALRAKEKLWQRCRQCRHAKPALADEQCRLAHTVCPRKICRPSDGLRHRKQ
jgi:aspartate/methionine/tyrosine aminotransferase